MIILKYKKEECCHLSKRNMSLTATVLTGVVIGTAMSIVVKSMLRSRKKPKSVLKRNADMALDAVCDVIHSLACVIK